LLFEYSWFQGINDSNKEISSIVHFVPVFLIGSSNFICINSFTLNLIVIKTAEKLVKKGSIPPFWMSANIPDGDEVNKK